MTTQDLIIACANHKVGRKSFQLFQNPNDTFTARKLVMARPIHSEEISCTSTDPHQALEQLLEELNRLGGMKKCGECGKKNTTTSSRCEKCVPRKINN